MNSARSSTVHYVLESCSRISLVNVTVAQGVWCINLVKPQMDLLQGSSYWRQFQGAVIIELKETLVFCVVIYGSVSVVRAIYISSRFEHFGWEQNTSF